MTADSKANSKFLKGAAILGIAAIVIKLMGAFFRIPLANLIGDTGMSYYQTAYPLYNWLLVISTAGIPAAMAKVIAEYNSVGNDRMVNKIFSTMLILMSTIGMISALVMAFSASWISVYVKNEGGYLSFLALAPAVFFVAVMSSFRGYFQGMQNMKPYAISQVVEQFFRVGLGLGLAVLLFDKGLEWASAGATFGATSGAFFGFLIIMFFYIAGNKKNNVHINNMMGDNLISRKSIIKKILMIAIPITLGASIIPIMTMLDLFIVMRRLHSIGIIDNANALYGQLTGYAQTLVNLPQTVCAAIQISVVPAVAGAVFIKNKKNLNDTIHTGLRLGLMIGLPAAFGLILLAEPIMKLLYPMQVDIASNTGAILSILGFGVIFLPLYQITTGILQGLGKPTKPAIHLFMGAILKGILNYVLVGIPVLNIKGAAIATVSAFALATLLNFIELYKNPNVDIDIKKIFVKPMLSAGIMAIFIVPMYNLFRRLYLDVFAKTEFVDAVLSPISDGSLQKIFLSSERWATVGTVLISGIIYIISLFITGTIKTEELAMLPGGNKIKKIVSKFKKN